MSSQLQLISAFEAIQVEYPQLVKVHNFTAKSDILLEDDDDNDVYLIREGKAAVLLSGGTEILLGAGDLIGEISFLLGDKRSASIIAKEKVICWSIRVEFMDQIFEKDPILSTQFYKALAQVIAERLVNGVKRQEQNLVFQEEGDPLIGVMRRQVLDLRQKFDNLVRIMLRDLTERTKKYAQQLKSISQRYRHDRSVEAQRARNLEIAAVMEEVQPFKLKILSEYHEKMEEIFQAIGTLLEQLLDLEKRNEVGQIANQIFSESLLADVELWKRRQVKNSHQIEPVLLLAHILREPTTHSMLWDFEALLVEWIDQVLLAQPTIEAIRARISLLSQKLIEGTEDNVNITVVNDVSGVILAKIYPQVAYISGNIYAVSHDASSLHYMDLGMDIRSGRVNMSFHRISSILSLVIGDCLLLPLEVPLESQHVIGIDGLIDYLPDRYLVRLVEKSMPYLQSGGSLLLSALLPSSDQVLFSSFFQWYMIRRTPKELEAIFQILGLKTTISTKDGAVVICIWKE